MPAIAAAPVYSQPRSASIASFRFRSALVLSLFLSLFVALPLAGTAAAQTIDIPAALNPDLEAPDTVVSLSGGHQFKSDVQDQGTEISRTNAMFSINHRMKLSDKSSMFMIGTYTIQHYDFSDNGGPQNYYQWGSIQRIVLAGLFGYELNERWRLVGGGMYRSWGERGASYADSITGGGLAGFDYHPSDDFSIGLLVGVFSDLEKGISLLPVPTLKWKINDEMRLNIGVVQVMDPGLGGELTYQLNQTVSVGGGIAYQTRRYRLDNQNIRTSANGRTTAQGIGGESEVPVFVTLQWRPTPKIALDLLTGAAFRGSVRVESKTGATVSSDSYDPAAFVGLKGQIAF